MKITSVSQNYIQSQNKNKNFKNGNVNFNAALVPSKLIEGFLDLCPAQHRQAPSLLSMLHNEQVLRGFGNTKINEVIEGIVEAPINEAFEVGWGFKPDKIKQNIFLAPEEEDLVYAAIAKVREKLSGISEDNNVKARFFDDAWEKDANGPIKELKDLVADLVTNANLIKEKTLGVYFSRLVQVGQDFLTEQVRKQGTGVGEQTRVIN